MRSALHQRLASLRQRIVTLGTLRATIGLPASKDIRATQWAALETELGASVSRLLRKLRAATVVPPGEGAREGSRRINALLGALELELSDSFVFFDTYMDALTQRHAPTLAPVLRGCDVLAADAMLRPGTPLELLEHPLVFCDRGFGAAILRESVAMPGGSSNPIPLIQIPYARLAEKHNLTSILHEAGHQALSRLGLERQLAEAIGRRLQRHGASARVIELYQLWSKELGPDFWGVCLSGIAQAATLREIMALPPRQVYRIAWMDPHPPGWVRAPIAFHACRQLWGRGPWDDWEAEWFETYPPAHCPATTRALLLEARRVIPVVVAALIEERLPAIGRSLTALFDLGGLSVEALRLAIPGAAMRRKGAAMRREGAVGMLPRRSEVPPSIQLALYRMVRHSGTIPEQVLDSWMTDWLTRLGQIEARNSARDHKGMLYA